MSQKKYRKKFIKYFKKNLVDSFLFSIFVQTNNKNKKQ